LEIAMIATLTIGTETLSNAEPDFVEMLPTIRRVASYAFRHLRRDVREDRLAEVVARAYAMFRRLVERGKAALAYATVLARFAIRQVRDGRRVGSKRSVLDVMSSHGQRRKGFSVELLSQREAHGDWEELTADRKATPADVAACRIDFRSWLGQLNRVKRRVALALASGTSTSDAASQFKMSPARVSQLRRELAESWNAFQAIPVGV